jgi:hypothetical protein
VVLDRQVRRGTDAILSIGVTGIANNNKFESTNAAWPVHYKDVRTLGKWFLDGVEFSTDLNSKSRYQGNAGLMVGDLVIGSTPTATQVVRAAAGVRYRASIMTKPASGVLFGSQTMRLQFLDKDFKTLSQKAVGTGDNIKWHKISTGAVVSPKGTRYARIVIGELSKETETGSFYYDNFTLEAF